jgi:hypothetical protein
MRGPFGISHRKMSYYRLTPIAFSLDWAALTSFYWKLNRTHQTTLSHYVVLLNFANGEKTEGGGRISVHPNLQRHARIRQEKLRRISAS